MNWWVRALLSLSLAYAIVEGLQQAWPVVLGAAVAGGLAFALAGVVLMRDAR